MGKSTHFFGQPVYGQVTNLLDKSKILQISRAKGGERYVKSFDAWSHMVTMLYGVIQRFDSLREIETSLKAEARKLSHVGLCKPPSRSTVADANARRPETVFEQTYRDLYQRYHGELCSDSRYSREPKWLKRLQIIDSTTVTLFSNAIFKGSGRNPKTGKKKGGIKVHAIIAANEGVPSDVRFTSAATHDHFMLSPEKLTHGDLLALDRAYIDYEKFEQMTQRGIVYVTKMKANLKYETRWDINYQNAEGKLAYNVKEVVFTKHITDGEDIRHRAWIITYPHIKRNKKGKITSVKMVSLLTNDMELDVEDIIEIYHKRWDIELMFKQIKQNFPLRYFYGESANAIKIQIWVTLIANLLLMVLKSRIKRSWSFSGFATALRIVLMYYIDLNRFFENPDADWQQIEQGKPMAPPGPPSLFY